MLLDHYVSAMDSWKGRIDSETDYDAFRWHQWVQPIDLNDDGAPFTGKLGFAFSVFLRQSSTAEFTFRQIRRLFISMQEK